MQNEPFDQELTWAYELGMRSEWLDGLLRVNATGFFYDVNDLQVQTVVNNSIVVNNAAGAEVYGFEVDGSVSITDSFSVDFAATYLETEITEVEVDAAIDPTRISVASDPTLQAVVSGGGIVPPTGAFNILGNELPKAPQIQFNIGINYTIDFESGADLTFRGDWSFQDSIFFNQFNDTGFAALPVNPITQDSYHWLKARLTYTGASGNWSASVFADNLTDEEVITNAVYNGAVSGQLGLGSLAPPRTYGVSLGYSF
ncbi:MAG: TonB-dependent receptor [Pseudomonadota bacterium]